MPTPSSNTLFESLPRTLPIYDMSQMFENWVNTSVFTAFATSKLGAAHVIYGADVIFLTSVLAFAAFAVVVGADRANFWIGNANAEDGVTTLNWSQFWATYGHDQASVAMQRGLYEIIILGIWQFWSLLCIILALVIASDVWNQVDSRIEEAAKDSIGLDTAVSSIHAVKTVALMFVAAFGASLTAYSFADSSFQLISWFDNYDTTKNEACQDNDNKNGDAGTCDSADPEGYALQQDMLIVHLIENIYYFIVTTAISLGGMIFYYSFQPLNDTPECNFDVDTSHYDGISAIIGNIKDYETCIANIDDIFKRMDLNNDGYLQRCEDAAFQHFMGSTKEYAAKFSSEFSVDSARALCAEGFDKPYNMDKSK